VAGKSAGFAIGIGIQDGASAGLDAINKRIAALSAPAERFNKSLAKFGEVTASTVPPRHADARRSRSGRGAGGGTPAADGGDHLGREPRRHGGTEPAMGRGRQPDQQDQRRAEHAGLAAERATRALGWRVVRPTRWTAA